MNRRAFLRDKGQDIVIFAPLLYLHTSLLVWKDSPAQTLVNLRGKRTGVLNPRVPGHLSACGPP